MMTKIVKGKKRARILNEVGFGGLEQYPVMRVLHRPGVL